MNVKGLLERLPVMRAKSTGKAQPDLTSGVPRDRFFEWALDVPETASVLEIGTKQALAGESTHSLGEFPNVLRENYVMADIEDGADVDVVADLHALPEDWTAQFDALVAVAVFEHLERPWIAASEVARVLRPGGRCYIATHQTFPLHGYPSDFFRFSKEALQLIFDDAGIRTLDISYEHRTQIIAPRAIMPPRYARQWNMEWPSYLVVLLHGEKP